MRRQSYSIILLVFIIQFMFIPLVVVGSNSEGSYLAYIYVPTVIDEEKGEGGIVKIGIYVTKSNTTDVVVEGPDYVAEDTLYAAKLALLVAEKVVGVKPGYTYHIVIETHGRIAGPSAGAAFAVLIMAAVLGDKINHNLSMTGALSGDGGVEGVSGLVIKANATKQYGLSEIVAPYNILSPPIYEKVKELNITVKPVANILEAYYEATGRRITASTTAKVPLPIAEEFQSYAYKVIDKIKSMERKVIDEAVSAGAEFKLVNSTRSYIKKQVSRALQALSEGAFYSAASLAFTAYVNLTSLEKYAELLKGNTTVRDEVNRLKEELNKLNKTLLNATYSCLGDFEVISAAWYRYYDAYRALKNIGKSSSVLATAQLIAYIDARISTAKYWYSLRNLACLVSPLRVNKTLIDRIAVYAYDYAKLAYNYVRSIVLEVTGSTRSVRSLDEAFQELEDVNKLGIPELTYAFAAELASRIYSPLKVDITLTSLLNRTSIERVLEGYRETVSYYNERLASRNIRLIMATAYLEYSRWIGNPYASAQMIAMADAYLTPILLALSKTNISIEKAPLPARSIPVGIPTTTYYFMVTAMGVGMVLAFTVGLYIGSKIAFPRDLERLKKSS